MNPSDKLLNPQQAIAGILGSICQKPELQKIDLMTLSLVIKAIEEVLEENKDEHAVSATNDELYT